MSISRRRTLHLVAGSAVVAAANTTFPAWAQAYPNRPVRLVVPFAPGGPNDLAARLIAQKLTDQLGKQFMVDNVGGAGGNIGTGQVARALPDGYTILVASPSFAVNPLLYDTVPYSPKESFDAVTMAVTAPTVLTVHPSLPAKTVKELVAYVKATPGKLSYASPGIGTPPHLLGELFRLSLGLDLVHVPFNSGGQAIASTVAGHTPISFGALPPAVPLVKDGKLRALALTSATPTQALPGTPTIAEAGYPDIAADIWSALLVPKGTPKDLIRLLQQETATALASSDVQVRLAGLGYQPVGNKSDDCTAQLAAELTKWEKVIQAANIKAG
jgi:tripartite-type tricarboxylate transporter receptor subunit TctC